MSLLKGGGCISHDESFTRIKWVTGKLIADRADVNSESMNGLFSNIKKEDMKAKIRVSWPNLDRESGVISLRTLEHLASLLFDRDLHNSLVPGA